MDFSLVRIELAQQKIRDQGGLNLGPRHWYQVEKYMLPELDDCITLREVLIYRADPWKP
jgi:hypothetical protein